MPKYDMCSDEVIKTKHVQNKPNLSNNVFVTGQNCEIGDDS